MLFAASGKPLKGLNPPTRPDDFRAVRKEPTDRLKVERNLLHRTDGSGR